ncbi:DUF935 family protein [Ornithobacterium rhinotracheale]|uniref:phage portal protein family protein n=1 Tax=Ornithobacterium rhinotracheale TaxID=28251 RepID=UPI00129C2A62|nr:DUF935 family protein [Ornithobacterium rhinotracheale]MRJ09175.1 DUF935 family protein [Ornithobacterium rhinotracheale]UOH77239.1 DUF935 domain-containing protein [Ornithobacterium rhinotracheale]
MSKTKKRYTDKGIHIKGNALKGSVHLTKNKSQDIARVTQLMVDIIRRQKRLWRMEINHWQSARYARYQVEFPRTYPLEEVYQDIMLDGHLTAVTENRTLRVVNNDFIFAIDGVKDEKLTDYIKDKEWFENTIKWAHESIYHGNSVIWIKEFTKGEIQEVELVERGLVIPERHLLLKDWDATEGIDIREVSDVLLMAQFYSPVGLLEKAAVYCILKRHSWGSWDEFEELFGIPIRIAKIASQSDAVKNEVAGWLEEMGSAPYGVFPIGTEVDIKENSKSDAFQVFYRKIEALDKELSKLVLHQTMTTENGGSRAQGGVHENTLKEVIYADNKKMLAFLNNKLIPAMRNLGYAIPENAKIQIEQVADPKEQIAVDGVLLGSGYILKKEYIEQTYGVEIEQMPSIGAPQVNNEASAKKS